MQLLVSLLCTLLLYTWRAGAAEDLQHPPNRIAIVGAGIGGSAAAYFMRQKFGNGVQIDVMERGEVGGRLATLEIAGNHYDSGGSIIHPLNLHMKTFVNELGLSSRPLSGNLLAIYNGEEFIFQESEWYLINLFKMLWNYGLNVLRMYMWMEDLMDKFMRIYRYQFFDYSFSSTETLLHALGGNDFLERLNETINDTMLKAGFSQKFIDETVTPAMRINFMQDAKVNGFVGSLSKAWMGSDLWAVEGGNNLVCPKLIDAAKAQLIQGTVTSVQEKTYTLSRGNPVKMYEVSLETLTGPRLAMYDIVVIAAPLHNGISNIHFLGFDPPIENFPSHYQQAVSTFVQGKINASFFGSKPSQFDHSEIFTTNNPKLFFCSVGAVTPVRWSSEAQGPKHSDVKVWRVFSTEPLREDQLHLLFESYQAVNAKTWLAYPYYSPPEKLPPVILHDRMYYITGIEWAASAMEMVAISAKNVALLSYHRWYGNHEQIDQEDLAEKLKSEL